MIEVKEQESSHLIEGIDYTRSVKTILDTEHYEMIEEVLNGMLFYHIYVFDMTPSIYKHMKKEWENVKQRALNEGWDAIHSYTQNHSFVRKFGGEQIAKIIGLTGEEYGVYRWELKQPSDSD